MPKKHPPKVTCPKHITGEARKWFRSMVDAYQGFEDEPNAVSILTEAAVQLQRIEAYRRDIQERGVVVDDRFGVPKENSSCPGERAAANLHRLLVRELGLEPTVTDETNRISRNQNLRVAQ
jgi:phage terminase small subunit